MNPTSLKLLWVKGQGDSWCDLFSIDVEHEYFKGLEGVYVIWHGGRDPGTVKVGQGFINERIRFHRTDSDVLKFKAQMLFMSWAPVEPAKRGGVERFLIEAMHPKVKCPLPDATAIEVNLPGSEPEGKPAEGGAVVQQSWQDLVQRDGEAPSALATHDVEIVETFKPAPIDGPVEPSAVKIKRISSLQKQFNDLLSPDAKKTSRGFFGGGAAPKDAKTDDIVETVAQMVMREAMLSRASDIHMEPMAEHLRVRFRIDGLLETILEIPSTLNISLVSHIRVRCGLDPEKGIGSAKPQDGRMAATVDGKEADLRLSTFPTAFGDKAVLRILPRNRKPLGLDELGLRPAHVETVRQLLTLPQGMVIVTGPTGCGKSSTLYTMLHSLNAETRNIVTLEDPIEVKIPGITQGAIQPQIGFTFAEGLRAILRQDPNVIMVGEARDTETAETALRAALTGHLIFTTLHTNSALGAIARLLDMGVEPFLIVSAVTAVFAQRLARRVCDQCRETYTPKSEELALLLSVAERAGIKLAADSIKELYRGQGCEACRFTGFKGRVAFFEIAPISSPLRPLILRKAAADEIRREAVRSGMETLFVDGLHKMQAGITSLDEVVRVAGSAD